jgi:predicted esterase
MVNEEVRNTLAKESDKAMEHFITSTIRRYYELELPHAGSSRKRWPLMIALHGYQGDKESMMRVAGTIADGKMVVISLQGHNQFFINYGTDDLIDPKTYRVGFGWGTSYKMEESIDLHHSAIRELIEVAVKTHHADPSCVFLLAFSQACAYNYRFVFTYPREILGVVGVCGGIPGDWNENPIYRKARTHVLHIAATKDVWFSRAKNLEFRRKLAQRAASLDFRFYNSPHKFPAASIPDIRKWIEKHS